MGGCSDGKGCCPCGFFSGPGEEQGSYLYLLSRFLVPVSCVGTETGNGVVGGREGGEAGS